jgi:hypothetical protein
MSNIVSLENRNTIPANLIDVFETDDMADDLTSGVSGGFSVVSIRGSKFRIKHGGDETLVTNADGDPVASLEVVMIKASPNLSHIYYEKSFEEGDAEAPDCFSIDGVRPHAESRNQQCDTCATCPNAVWGSKITPAGKKAKKCQDSRRMAVVPAGDVDNEVYGGPMLFRIPAASLGDLATFGKGLKAKGFPYNTIVARIGFDTNVSYPKLTFKAVRPLNDEELQKVADHITSGRANTILDSDAEFLAAPAPAKKPEPPKPETSQSVDIEFEVEEPAPVAKKAEPKPAAKKAEPKPAAKKAEPKPEPVREASPLDNDLDDILSDLDELN